MWPWLDGFLQSLPAWYEVLLWCLGGLGLPALFFWSAYEELDGDVTSMLAFLSIVILVGSVVSGNWPAILFGASIVLLIEGVSRLAHLIARSFARGVDLVRHAWGWCKNALRGFQEKRERDPQYILAQCKKNLDQAKKSRAQIDGSDTDIGEVLNFDQAGNALLKFLEQLFSLVEDTDAYLVASTHDEADRKRADGIYPDTPLEQFSLLTGAGTVDAVAMGKIRTCAQGLIESTVRVFQRLPRETIKERALRGAGRITGLHEALNGIIPLSESTSTTGLVADLETGQLQKRMLEQLASAAKPIRA